MIQTCCSLFDLLIFEHFSIHSFIKESRMLCVSSRNKVFTIFLSRHKQLAMKVKSCKTDRHVFHHFESICTAPAAIYNIFMNVKQTRFFFNMSSHMAISKPINMEMLRANVPAIKKLLSARNRNKDVNQHE